MQQRQLGNLGLTSSAIGYGSMGISVAYGEGDEQGGTAAIQRAYELGITHIDTAEMYGWGDNERIVGRAIKDFRDDVVLATKFGFTAPDLGVDSRPDHIREVLHNSLRNLGVDHVDVFYQHRVDPNVPIEDVAGTVREFIEQGKVKYFGLSEAGEQTIRRAHAVQPVSVLQTEYSLFERDVESLFPTLRELGIGFVAYSPLGRGFLTGTAKPATEYSDGDIRQYDPRWQGENFDKNTQAMQQLAGLAESLGASLSQFALAWLLAQGDDIVPIPGSRKASRVEENAAAADIEVSPAVLERVAEILPAGGHGARYIDAMLPEWN
ncbi:oxidoreductase [Mycolicibacterium chitae]|uniref:Putative pyridoxine 4-dehydrogenase n=1 Tax=Mycolicibacterium chitae TaxID=1792 RepID=A0A3S4RGP5_MYCCI|nr:aldo/keto reductase [Mycolicibacterium chitae]MCV7104980.1 aldo/keto reductase [Mycolicibacterium chitae]BBZ04223.1 oxidoreductase [Mycolicibacterium chitae]VEG47871.1 putative pyridoxine 4-dehydrogenase [Mycolicibacterium chitae]